MALSGACTSNTRPRRARRAESFPVRRWLQLGAASAGVSAALMAYPLFGPQVVAVADPESSTSSTEAGPDAGSSPADAPGATDDTSNDTAGGAIDADEADDIATDEDADLADLDPDPDLSDKDIEDVEDSGDVEDIEDEVPVDDDEPTVPVSEAPSKDADEAAPATPVAAEPAESEPPVEAYRTIDAAATPAALVDGPAATTATMITPEQAQQIAPVVTAGGLLKPYHRFAASIITDVTLTLQNLIDALPLDSDAKAFLEGALWAVRRGFFNLAPTAAPIQVTGVLEGPITGTLGVIDPEGDRIYYRITRGPAEGTVVLNKDGTYTYTPGEDFDGVDTFHVYAMDVGLHVNLLDPLRPWGVDVRSLINQNAITFDFQYNTGADHWTPEYRAALEEAARRLTVYFRVNAPVVLTFDVTGENDPAAGYLAFAGSNLVNGAPGYWNTVAQYELLTGKDSNGATRDGYITWNFYYNWGTGDTIGANQYDFESTAMHELMHAFGFLSNLNRPGENNNLYWPTFTSFVVTATRARPINRRHEWDSRYDDNLVGFNGGLYFGGSNAVRAYGGLVPLYTPNPWEPGSSATHLDDTTFTGADDQLMNAKSGKGPGIRSLSAIEIGILRDLGYYVVALPAPGPAETVLV